MMLKKIIILLLFIASMVTANTTVEQKTNKHKWIEIAEHIYLIYSDDGHGTGFAVKDEKGRVFIVTNRHVCGFKGASMTLKDHLGNEYPVTKRWISRTTDLCAIEAPISAIPLNMAKSVEVGAKFITAGYPLVRFMSQHEGHVIGIQTEDSHIVHQIPQDLSNDMCSNVGSIIEVVENKKSYRLCKVLLADIAITDLYIGGGASGSPIVDAQTHEVIGVLFGGRQIGFSLVLGSFIQVKDLRTFLNAISN